MTEPRSRTDVIVIGAGPAGATSAALLASWGRSIVLVHRESAQPGLAESLPASTRKLLRFLGQSDIVEAASFHPNFGNISRWAGKHAVTRSEEHGYHVSRPEFDGVLRAGARRCGAVLVEGQVQNVEFGRSVKVDVTAGDGSSLGYDAAFALDCSGRGGVIARKGLRRFDAGYRTLAVSAEWACDRWPDDERAHTVVDSYADGWAWSVPLSANRRQCTVMIDQDRTTIRKANLHTLYRTELAKTAEIAERLSSATQTTAPWACDASLYGAERAADDRVLLVGDAASFIEPLSAAGVKKALTSAWRAAVVVNTCLDSPAMQRAAFDFYNRRERQVYCECRTRAAGFFSAAAAVYDDPFWATRAASAAGGRIEAGSELSDADLAGDPSIRRAFDSLRVAPAIDLVGGAEVRFAQAAVIEGSQIVMRDALVLPGFDEPVRFAAGINLPELMRMSSRCRDVASVIDTYHAQIGRVDPAAILGGLSVLVGKGLLQIR
jgi:2-polyprenyl-6-methoxyphenol hydroxylase-like FAD-dependent oxidoreductase